MPANLMSIRTSNSPTGRRSMVVRSSGALAAGAAYAATVVMPGVLLRGFRARLPSFRPGTALGLPDRSAFTQTTVLRTHAVRTTGGVRLLCVRPRIDREYWTHG